jgi:hypothetical protein
MVVLFVRYAVAALFAPLWLFYLLALLWLLCPTMVVLLARSAVAALPHYGCFTCSLCCGCSVCPTMVVLLARSAVAALPHYGCFTCSLCCGCSVCPTMVVLLARSAVAALFAPLWFFYSFDLLWLLCCSFCCCFFLAEKSTKGRTLIKAKISRYGKTIFFVFKFLFKNISENTSRESWAYLAYVIPSFASLWPP